MAINYDQSGVTYDDSSYTYDGEKIVPFIRDDKHIKFIYQDLFAILFLKDLLLQLKYLDSLKEFVLQLDKNITFPFMENLILGQYKDYSIKFIYSDSGRVY